MTTKTKTKKQEVAKTPPAKLLAAATLRPSINAAAVIEEYGKTFGDQDIMALADELADNIKQVNAGDMARCEGMLMGQAQALQAIFMNLSRRSIKQEHMKNMETFLRLALKAQGQCRATIETLTAIKNPPVIYAKQANISNGHQQINNGIPAPATQAENIKNQQNELLEHTHGERLDTRTTNKASGIDTDMEAVGKVNRGKNT